MILNNRLDAKSKNSPIIEVNLRLADSPGGPHLPSSKESEENHAIQISVNPDNLSIQNYEHDSSDPPEPSNASGFVIEKESEHQHFSKMLRARSKIWMYEWILDLKDGENPVTLVSNQLGLCWSGESDWLKTASKIRKDLNSVRTKLVSSAFIKSFYIISSKATL